jgi:ABC-type multidrug transport system ATPase subunit
VKAAEASSKDSQKTQWMNITVINAGKRFNRDWVFRNMNLELKSGMHYAITGNNGSGKSTLLQCIAGALYTNEGSINYAINDVAIKSENQYQFISICAPYLEIIEEMSAMEFLHYHSSFKPFKKGIDPTSILTEIGLIKSKDKQIRYYSSGMKQRIKLAQAFFSDTPVLMLDEPCTNLDQKGIDLYNHLISTYCSNRLVIISSNDKTEYKSCGEEIKVGM